MLPTSIVCGIVLVSGVGRGCVVLPITNMTLRLWCALVVCNNVNLTLTLRVFVVLG